MNRDECINCGKNEATVWKCEICKTFLVCKNCVNERVWYALMKEHHKEGHISVELVDV